MRNTSKTKIVASEETSETIKKFPLVIPTPFDIKPLYSVGISPTITADIYPERNLRSRYSENDEVRDGWQINYRGNRSGKIHASSFCYTVLQVHDDLRERYLHYNKTKTTRVSRVSQENEELD